MEMEMQNRGESNYIGCNQVTFGMSKGANLEHDFREAES